MPQTAADGDAIASAYGREVIDLFDELAPGDKVLWGDRTQPCTVARVVDADDRIGQSLTASVVSSRPSWKDKDDEEYTLQAGDTFVVPTGWGMRGKRFVLIQGPRGGFYAIVKAKKQGRTYPAMFRAVRSFHKTKLGQKGQGAFGFEQWFDDTLRVVGHGDPPEVLDPEGDLPAYDDIKDNRAVYYSQDEGDHIPIGTVDDVFDEGLWNVRDRMKALESDETIDDDDSWDAVPDAERVSQKPQRTAAGIGTVVVTDIFESQYGLKAALDTPAPWETPDDARPANDVLKDTPWDENHRQWDPDREAWTVDADELVKVARELAEADYLVRDEAERPAAD